MAPVTKVMLPDRSAAASSRAATCLSTSWGLLRLAGGGRGYVAPSGTGRIVRSTPAASTAASVEATRIASFAASRSVPAKLRPAMNSDTVRPDPAEQAERDELRRPRRGVGRRTGGEPRPRG